ncbi:PKD repeat protein [Salinibacter ruber]|uniref:PKD domain-containing protein n=1 Tax=Salinibacter ruber TaxID=146919 RepID=UPI002169AB68|nr:PKD domain-containing protein [Salinibacter ruber]MCS3939985.1 PKD repeat protein [Salinibacter ruber]
MHLCSLNVPRSRGGRLVLLGVALLLSGVVGTAQAQHLDNGFYGKLGAGLSGYTGDLAGPRAGAPQEFGADAIGRLPLVAVGELGYQLSPRWGLALGGQAGSYVSVGNAAPATDSYRRYTSHLLGRYTFGAPDRRVAFYLDAGLNVTAGGPTHTGIGPSVGGGIDIRAGRAVSLYVESRLHATVPDDAVDGRGRGAEGWSFDTVNQPLGFGLRFSLTTPTAPEIIALDAPTEVEAGTTATFTVTINEEEAARPLDRRWRFGDGTEGTGRTVTHTYRRPGTYPVTVSAHNEAGEATASTTIRVTRASAPPSPPEAPWVVSLTARPNPVRVGEPVQLRTAVEGEKPFTYQWTVDGTTATRGPAPTYTFERPGRHTVQVRVSNDGGTQTRSMTVQAERRTAKRPSPQPAGLWAVGVASMRNPAGAKRMARRYRNRLADAPVSVRIVEHMLDQERHFRVVVGRYETQAAAQQARETYRRALPPKAWAVRLE